MDIYENLQVSDQGNVIYSLGNDYVSNKHGTSLSHGEGWGDGTVATMSAHSIRTRVQSLSTHGQMTHG